MKTIDDEYLRSFEALLEEHNEQEAPADARDTQADAIRQSIATLQACLPEGARLTLSGVMDREGLVSDYSDDPMLHVETTLYGGPKP